MSDHGRSNSGHGADLTRVLNRLDIAALAVGAMVGWGWVVLAGAWISGAGLLGTVIAFAIGGGLIVLIGLTYAELVAALPFAGGEHVFVDRAFGSTPAFVATWAIVLGYVSVVTFEAIALPVALVYLFPDLKQIPLWTIAGYQVHLTEVLIGSGAAVAVALLNVLGIKTASRVQALVVFLVICAGLVLIVGGLAYDGPPPVKTPFTMTGLVSVVVMVPFLFVGFDVIPQAAEEIDLPYAKIGSVVIASVLIATLFYMGVVFGVGSAPLAQGTELASADAAKALWHSSAMGTFVVVAGVAGILTSWNAFLIGGSRALFALARAGQIPRSLAAVHPRFGTPYKAIIAIAALSVFAPLLGRQALIWIVDAGGLAIVLAYAFVAASFLHLRRTAPDMERPYRTPMGKLIGWLALLCSLGLSLLYLPFSPSGLVWPEEWLIVFVWTVLGVIVFFSTKQHRS
tara:strand:+ start:32998 stop:34365 length:1368 start_codon:yes stop_codon:yes gene_type:complete